MNPLTSSAETLFDGPPNELIGCVSRFRVNLPPALLEPVPLSLVDAVTSPLALQIAVIPCVVTATDVTCGNIDPGATLIV